MLRRFSSASALLSVRKLWPRGRPGECRWVATGTQSRGQAMVIVDFRAGTDSHAAPHPGSLVTSGTPLRGRPEAPWHCDRCGTGPGRSRLDSTQPHDSGCGGPAWPAGCGAIETCGVHRGSSDTRGSRPAQRFLGVSESRPDPQTLHPGRKIECIFLISAGEVDSRELAP